MKNFHNILKLLTWNNQSYPIGSYIFSSGLEHAVEINIVSSAKELDCWLRDLLKFGKEVLPHKLKYGTEGWQLLV